MCMCHHFLGQSSHFLVATLHFEGGVFSVFAERVITIVPCSGNNGLRSSVCMSEEDPGVAGTTRTSQLCS